MINQNVEESTVTAPPGVERNNAKQGQRIRRLATKPFSLFWRRESRDNTLKRDENSGRKEDLVEVKIIDCQIRNGSSKEPFGFFRNIKKHMQIKNLMARRSKQKIKESEVSTLSHEINDSSMLQSDSSVTSVKNKDVESDLSETFLNYNTLRISIEAAEIVKGPLSWQECSAFRINNAMEEISDSRGDDVNTIDTSFKGKTMAQYAQSIDPKDDQPCTSTEEQEMLSTTSINTVESVEDSNNKEQMVTSCNLIENLTNDNRAKVSLTEELLKLSKYGWYWGPISGNEADAKLISEPDGAFLVRDSSDDRYVLTLSFKSSGKLLHARMEHSGGLFSLCNQSECEGFTSVAALINHSMNFSQSAVFCYSRPKYPGYPSFPVRLTKPVSRFTQVRSLQYLCRFVIRQNTRLDNIHKLPLPKTIKGYIEEAHY